MMRRVVLLLLVLVLPPFGRGDARAGVSDQDVAKALNDALATDGPLVVDSVTLDGDLVRALYADRNGAPLWRGQEQEILRVLQDATTEGLDPAAYHTDAIATRLSDESAAAIAAHDLILSDALLHYAPDVRYGRVRPTRVTAEAAVAPPPLDPVALVRAAAEATDVPAALADLPPRHPSYRALRMALAQYRGLLAKGTRWPVVPDGPTLRPGMSDPAVPALRARLAATGELSHDSTPASKLYDKSVVAAVKRFQGEHALDPDGVVGAKARAALNVGLGTRIEQIVANMERWRWLPEDLGPRHVLVNIATYRLTLVEGGSPDLNMPVIVGETDKMTPMFSSEITYVIFNPSWRVPDKIARNELLPKVQRDSQYFAKQGIRLIGTWQPEESEDGDHTWSGARRAAGFRLKQDPGPQNPLGRVKFHIPNVFGVYLHDTPNKNLFHKDQRTLSHGCVRLGEALTLADRLLGELPSWNADKRAKALSNWTTTAVRLDDPMPVHLIYETAWVDADGTPHFADDVYGRDRRLVDHLNGRPEMTQVAGPRIAEP